MVVLLLFILISAFQDTTVAESPLDRIIRLQWEKFQKSDLAKEFRNNGEESETKGIRPKPIHVCEHDSYMERLGSDSPYSEISRLKLADYILQKKRALQAIEAQNTTTPKPDSQPVPSPSNSSSPNNTHWAPIRMYANHTLVSTSDPLSCTSVGQVVQVDQSYTNSAGQETDLYTCQKTDLLTSSKVDYLLDYVMPTVLTLVNQIISVQPVQGNLILSQEYHALYGDECRTNVVIPSAMIDGPGIPNADYYLFVSARPNPNPDVLANALPCSHYFVGDTLHFDKPLAGSINFNPGSSSLLNDSSDAFAFAQNVKTGLHEITHALGFTSSLYSDYRTPEGGFYKTPVFNTTYNVVGITWKMATPRVLAFGQQHYNCSSLDGMELEEWGIPSDQPGSHWEERLVDSEYMAAISNVESQLSYLTLSLFEDTGWYQANTSMAEPWHYGVREGCDWIQKPCSSLTWNRYWCDDPSAIACNGHRTARGQCNLATYTSALPVQFQYFPQSPAEGGGENWNNFCPIYYGFSNTYCHDPNGQMAVYGNPYGEVYGSGSSCWDMSSSQQTSGCFPTRCSVQVNTNKTILTVNIGGNWFGCPQEGGDITISVNGEQITLMCPFVEFFCSELPGSTVEYTFDPSQNVPVLDAPTPPRGGPIYPDNPIPPPGGLPSIIPPSYSEGITQLFDEWGLEVGSTLFWLLVGLGILIVLVGLIVCCCKRR